MPNLSHLSPSFVSSFKDRTPPWGFDGLGYFVYKRTYSRRLDDHTTEEWYQTCARVVNGLQDVGAGYTEDELERLYAALFQLKAMPAGRMLWQLGTENVERFGGDSLCNCWFTNITRPEDFGFIFDELMLGGGVGFGLKNVDYLPHVTQRHAAVPRHEKDADLIVSDKREGWVHLLEESLRAAFGQRAAFDYSLQLIRPKGTPIRTFGGTASGPGILEEGITKIGRVLDGAYGRKLTSVEVLDICNIIGSVVVSGNVRRSAQIALGVPEDREYLQAKRWDLGDIPAWRAMSNNSVFAHDIEALPEEFWDGYAGNGEPYGLFNLESSQVYGRAGEELPDFSIQGVNPCAEIPLSSWESCNLAELFLPNIESEEEFRDLAGLLYKGQKAIAALPYRRPETTDIVGTNMRLGLSVSGVAQRTDRLYWLSPTYEYLRALDRDWSKERGWPESVRLTTVKPSGTLSLLAGVTPGVHPGFSEWHVRRVRVAHNDPLVDVARRDGYFIEPVRQLDGTLDESTQVVSFPCRFPSSTMFAENVSAIDQLKLSNRMQRDWVDNSVSCTVYYAPEELPRIQEYLQENWHAMKSVSFLRREDHGFQQAPLEAISETEYMYYRSQLHASGSLTSSDLGDAPIVDECDEGACPIR